MFTHGLDIELSVGLLPTLIFPHSTFYPPFRIHFHIFRFRILLSAFRVPQFRILPMTAWRWASTETNVDKNWFTRVLCMFIFRKSFSLTSGSGGWFLCSYSITHSRIHSWRYCLAVEWRQRFNENKKRFHQYHPLGYWEQSVPNCSFRYCLNFNLLTLLGKRADSAVTEMAILCTL